MLVVQDDDTDTDASPDADDDLNPYADFDLTPLPKTSDPTYAAVVAAREADMQQLASSGLGSIRMFRQQMYDDYVAESEVTNMDAYGKPGL